MGFCYNCGQELKGGMKYCPKCGTKMIEDEDVGESSNNSMDNKSTDIKNYVDLRKKETRRYRIIGVIVLVVIVLFGILGGNDKKQDTPINETNNYNGEEEYPFSEVFDNAELADNFEEVCIAIDIDIDEVKNMERKDDWAAGARYEFSYKESKLILYTNIDSTINAIRLADLTYLYQQEDELLDANNYIVDENNTNVIIIEDYKLGEYGKSVTLNDKEYIWYYIPAGTYKITNQVNWCVVYLDKNNTIINSDGYTESVMVSSLNFTSFGQEETLTISEDEHLFITEHAIITLVLVE